ncbi:MAG: hypothetical protein RLZZ21_256 [Planctomycetota bacterium]
MPSHSDQRPVYKVLLTETIEAHGIGTITLVGQLVPMNPFTLLVKCGEKFHTPEGWYFDRREAELEAADEIEARAARLVAQAEKLRSSAVVEAV